MPTEAQARLSNTKTIDMKTTLITCLLLAFIPGIHAQQHPRPPRMMQSFDTDSPMVHDPVMAYENGIYYLYATGRGIQVMTSTDRKRWTFHPQSVINTIPAWTHDSVPNFRDHIWAPDIIRYHGRWWLTYACSSFGKNISAIGVMSNTTLNMNDTANYQWKDSGSVICSMEGRNNWNAIDPNIIIDEKDTPWMTFGSFWGGIELIRLDSNMHATSPLDIRTIATRHATTLKVQPGANAIEAPFIFHHRDYYYLFVSFDYCCRGMNSDYKVAVGRSNAITGPYSDRNGKLMIEGGGTVILQGDGKQWAAAGHCGVYHFGDNDILICHGYNIPQDGMSVLVQKKIQWTTDEWPELVDETGI